MGSLSNNELRLHCYGSCLCVLEGYNFANYFNDRNLIKSFCNNKLFPKQPSLLMMCRRECIFLVQNVSNVTVVIVQWIYFIICTIHSRAQKCIPCHCVSLKWREVLTHWGRDKMAAIFQTTLSNAFSWMKMLEFRLKYHWSLFLRFEFTIFQHWLR